MSLFCPNEVCLNHERGQNVPNVPSSLEQRIGAPRARDQGERSLPMMLFSIRSSIDNGFSVFFEWVPRVLGFLAVLLIGYLIAKLVGNLVHRLTHRAGLDRTVHNGTGGN